MRKIIFIGRSEAGKTSLTQAMKGEHITYHKTQYVNNYDVIIDTPGEYAETKTLGGALAVYSYEADVVGLLLSAIEPYSLYPPNVTTLCNREVIGIVTKIDHPQANVRQAEEWLRLAGCEKIFRISSYTGEGVPELLEFLKEDGEDVYKRQIRGCVGCGSCFATGKCVFDNDGVNEISRRLVEFDGIVVGSPVYYAGASGQLCCFLDLSLIHI